MKIAKFILPALALVLAGLVIGRFTAPSHNNGAESSPHSEGATASEYTCSMHPQIRQPNPGKCPICAMDLIPVETANNDHAEPGEISFSPHAQALAQIQTTAAERRIPDAEVRLFGKVLPDESLKRSITARFPARIERLYVNFTGVEVNSGDHLAKIYSPDLLTAQSELLSAMRFKDPRAVRAAREKLSLWGFSEAAIQAIQNQGEPEDTMDIDSPLGGFVMKKMVNEGDYVATGAVLFQIADLSTVWVMLDAYEMDKPWLRFGQSATFTAEALPGRTFEGRISFIAPVLDETTRTFKVRLNIPNPDLALRPGMFVTGTVHARVAGDGLVLDPSLEGKWISPMHPEIIKDAPGQCDVCGMDMVPASALGYTSASDVEIPLVVPASAVLQTGKRAVVYVEIPDRERPTYEGREIVLGPRADDAYIVKSGLEEGERVVTNGAFKIDSSLQLLAKPSMMSGEDPDAPPMLEATPEMKAAMGTLTKDYFPLWRGLAADDLPAAQVAATQLESQIHQFHGLPGNAEASEFFETTLAALGKSASALEKSEDLDKAREAFERISTTLIRAVRSIGFPEGVTAHLAFCPMTFEGRRSDWLQDDKTLLNPYFGAAMLQCGEFEDLSTPASPSTPARPPAGHQH